MKSLVHHRRLPDYHPRLLNDLLMHGNYELCKKILIRLADTLRDTEKIIRYVPLDPRDFLVEEPVVVKKRGLMDRFATDEKIITFVDSYKILNQKLARHWLE
jgi:hypothetical protein